MLKRIVDSPYLNLFSGFILLITSSIELVVSFDEYQIGAEHGIFVFSIVQILKVIPELLHSAKELEEAEELELKKHNVKNIK